MQRNENHAYRFTTNAPSLLSLYWDNAKTYYHYFGLPGFGIGCIPGFATATISGMVAGACSFNFDVAAEWAGKSFFTSALVGQAITGSIGAIFVAPFTTISSWYNRKFKLNHEIDPHVKIFNRFLSDQDKQSIIDEILLYSDPTSLSSIALLELLRAGNKSPANPMSKDIRGMLGIDEKSSPKDKFLSRKWSAVAKYMTEKTRNGEAYVENGKGLFNTILDIAERNAHKPENPDLENDRNSSGMNCLQQAVVEGNLQHVQEILQSVTNDNQKKANSSAINDMQQAVQEKNVHAFQEALSSVMNSKDKKDKKESLLSSKVYHNDSYHHEKTALHLALEFNQPEIAIALLKAGARPQINIAGVWDVSPFHMAVMTGNTKMAQALYRFNDQWINEVSVNYSDLEKHKKKIAEELVRDWKINPAIVANESFLENARNKTSLELAYEFKQPDMQANLPTMVHIDPEDENKRIKAKDPLYERLIRDFEKLIPTIQSPLWKEVKKPGFFSGKQNPGGVQDLKDFLLERKIHHSGDIRSKPRMEVVELAAQLRKLGSKLFSSTSVDANELYKLIATLGETRNEQAFDALNKFDIGGYNELQIASVVSTMHALREPAYEKLWNGFMMSNIVNKELHATLALLDDYCKSSSVHLTFSGHAKRRFAPLVRRFLQTKEELSIEKILNFFAANLDPEEVNQDGSLMRRLNFIAVKTGRVFEIGRDQPGLGQDEALVLPQQQMPPRIPHADGESPARAAASIVRLRPGSYRNDI